MMLSDKRLSPSSSLSKLLGHGNAMGIQQRKNTALQYAVAMLCRCPSVEGQAQKARQESPSSSPGRKGGWGGGGKPGRKNGGQSAFLVHQPFSPTAV